MQTDDSAVIQRRMCGVRVHRVGPKMSLKRNKSPEIHPLIIPKYSFIECWKNRSRAKPQMPEEVSVHKKNSRRNKWIEDPAEVSVRDSPPVCVPLSVCCCSFPVPHFFHILTT